MYAWTVTSVAVGRICPRYAQRCGEPGAIACHPVGGSPQRRCAKIFINCTTDSSPSDPGQTGSPKKWALKNHAAGFTRARPSIAPNPFGPPGVVVQAIVSTIRSIASGNGGSVRARPDPPPPPGCGVNPGALQPTWVAQALFRKEPKA